MCNFVVLTMNFNEVCMYTHDKIIQKKLCLKVIVIHLLFIVFKLFIVPTYYWRKRRCLSQVRPRSDFLGRFTTIMTILQCEKKSDLKVRGIFIVPKYVVFSSIEASLMILTMKNLPTWIPLSDHFLPMTSFHHY